MIEASLQDVFYNRIPPQEGGGIRIIFNYKEEEIQSDVFIFTNDADVQHVLNFIAMAPSPEQLMVDLRNIMEITVH